MKFIEILLKNVKSIGKTALAFSSASFSVLSIILSFITWEEMGVANIFVKMLIFVLIIIMALIGSTLWISVFKRKRLLWTTGDGRVTVCYSDIMKLSFPKKKTVKKIVVIPVNTCFDTIVDENISLYL